MRTHKIQKGSEASKALTLLSTSPFLPSPVINLSYIAYSNNSQHPLLPTSMYLLLLGEGEANAVGTEVVDGVPFPQERITEDSQGTNWLGEICPHH